MGAKRIDIFFEDHIGVGLRWRTHCVFPLTLSLSVMFVTITVGIGNREYC